MTKDVVRKFVDAIEANGITRFYVYSTDHSELLDIGSDSTRAWFDDDNETLWYLKISANVQPWDNRPMCLGALPYEEIVIIYVPADVNTIIKIANAVGYELTDDVTEWIKKAGSQAGLYPAQSNPRTDEDGKPILYNHMPTCN